MSLCPHPREVVNTLADFFRSVQLPRTVSSLLQEADETKLEKITDAAVADLVASLEEHSSSMDYLIEMLEKAGYVADSRTEKHSCEILQVSRPPTASTVVPTASTAGALSPSGWYDPTVGSEDDLYVNDDDRGFSVRTVTEDGYLRELHCLRELRSVSTHAETLRSDTICTNSPMFQATSKERHNCYIDDTPDELFIGGTHQSSGLVNPPPLTRNLLVMNGNEKEKEEIIPIDSAETMVIGGLELSLDDAMSQPGSPRNVAHSPAEDDYAVDRSVRLMTLVQHGVDVPFFKQSDTLEPVCAHKDATPPHDLPSFITNIVTAPRDFPPYTNNIFSDPHDPPPLATSAMTVIHDRPSPTNNVLISAPRVLPPTASNNIIAPDGFLSPNKATYQYDLSRPATVTAPHDLLPPVDSATGMDDLLVPTNTSSRIARLMNENAAENHNAYARSAETEWGSNSEVPHFGVQICPQVVPQDNHCAQPGMVERDIEMGADDVNEQLRPAFGARRKRGLKDIKGVNYAPSGDSFYPVEYDGVTYDSFNLRVIFERDVLGFEDTKEFPFNLNSVISGRYQVVEYLGSAAFSKAIQCLDLVDNRMVCLKVIKNDKDFFDQSLDEIKLLNLLNANCDPDEKHILRIIDYFYHKEHLILVTELLRENLYEFGKFCRESGAAPYFTLGHLQRIAYQICEALEYVHTLRLIHCDLKPENILLKSYSRVEVKVIDFGSSCFVDDNLSTYCQSRSYRAPEVMLGLPYGQAVDLWSFGCILAELWTGYVLFQNDSVQTLLARITGIIGDFPEWMLQCGKYVSNYYTQNATLYQQSTDGLIHLLIPKRTSLRHRMKTNDAEFIDFLDNLLKLDPRERLTAKDALQHPFFNNYYSDGLASLR
eukprot:GEMP01007094.1.p1 GENE.GEMP01007094.1~~GEMP01007094.1.p1  ORF type:complete len:881 (+),score=124.17 GEMP01007094.1:43-2685(+)